MSRAPEPSEWVALGVLGKPRGLRGDLWLRAYNESAGSLAPGARVRVVLADGSTRSAVVESLLTQGDGLVIHLQGFDSREASVALVRASLELQRQDFPPLEAGEYYHCDLPGVAVVDRDGKAIGTVTSVEAYPTVDALVVKTATGSLELPMIDDVVLSLDMVARRVVVDLTVLDLPASDASDPST